MGGSGALGGIGTGSSLGLAKLPRAFNIGLTWLPFEKGEELVLLSPLALSRVGLRYVRWVIVCLAALGGNCILVVLNRARVCFVIPAFVFSHGCRRTAKVLI